MCATRSRFKAAFAAILVTATAAIAAPYDFKLVPSDALVRRTRGASPVVLTLIVRRERGAPEFVAPRTLVVRAISGDNVAQITIERDDAVAGDGLYQEFVYHCSLPRQMTGPTMLELNRPDAGGTVRTMVSVITSPSYDAIAQSAAAAQTATPMPAAPVVDEAPPPSTTPALDQAVGEATRAGLVPNEPVYFAANTRAFHTIHRLDARFQLSFRFFFGDSSNWLAPVFTMTTTSLWDLHSYSFPFRDSTYRPGLAWTTPVHPVPGHDKWTLSSTFGVEHESNGRGPDPDSPLSPANNDDLSRSMNRVYLTPKLTWKNERFGVFTFAPKFFVPFAVADNNPDISRYRGRADWLLTWRSRESGGHIVNILTRQGTDWGRHFVQVDYGVPCFPQSWLLFQWLYGYGETLRDYKVRNPGTLRVGWMIKPWAQGR